MRVWIDLANSPHVPVMAPIVERLRAKGNDVLLTARDHAQTVELARSRWPEVLVVGRQSPPGLAAKGLTIVRRAEKLRRFARHARPDVAFSHGSYAQLLAARAAGIPGMTMMDYEHQPANHLSFRLARRVVVPSVFPDDALSRFGASPEKVIRYEGFKEELYLAGFQPDARVLDRLGLDPRKVIAVFRPPPEGALYHRTANDRFDELLGLARGQETVEAVLLPRTPEQRRRYAALLPRVPERAVDGASLLALADLVIGAGGTMNRESAVLGTPTYTVFAGRPAAVDVELMRMGRLRDLLAPGSPRFEKRARNGSAPAEARRDAILNVVLGALEES